MRANRDGVHGVTAAERDGVIVPAEHELMMGVADQLDIGHSRIPAATPAPATERIPAGSRVCFTGAATVGWGRFPHRRPASENRASGTPQPVEKREVRRCR